MLLLVTGASGLLGANFILTVQAMIPCRIVAVSATTTTCFPHADNLCLDLGDAAATRRLVREVQPDWIVNFAACTDVDWCELHPLQAKRLHVDAAEELACLAGETGARYLYMSSDSVFAGDAATYSEEDRPSPKNVYAASKLAGELSCIKINPLTLIVRSNFYGWNLQEKSSLAEWILDRLQQQRPVPGFRDIFFAPLLANDLSIALLRLMHRKATGLVHLASSDSCSKFQFARRVARIFGHDPNLVRPASSQDAGFTALRPQRTVLVSRRPDTPATPSIEAGLRRMHELATTGFKDSLKQCLQEKSHEYATDTTC